MVFFDLENPSLQQSYEIDILQGATISIAYSFFCTGLKPCICMLSKSQFRQLHDNLQIFVDMPKNFRIQ